MVFNSKFDVETTRQTNAPMELPAHSLDGSRNSRNRGATFETGNAVKLFAIEVRYYQPVDESESTLVQSHHRMISYSP